MTTNTADRLDSSLNRDTNGGGHRPFLESFTHKAGAVALAGVIAVATIGCGSSGGGSGLSGGGSSSATDTPADTPTIPGCEGNTAVVIGTQTWHSKNMCTDTHTDGTAIPSWTKSAVNTFSYAETGTGTNTESAAGAQANKDWGNLYQWETADNICPTGWHLPSSAEFVTLFDGLDPATITNVGFGWRGTDDTTGAGARAKTGGDSGFNALLTGIRKWDGVFLDKTTLTHFWTSSPAGTKGLFWLLDSTHGNVARNEDFRSNGFSVRCIQD